ncbi:HupE/UreJ family protein [Piscinibacter terrae]|uniref:Urease accessory protein UreJ n=1 Tax=Piscinibacter terrae TaxID=2496871 RepID=A0A3N7HNH1_9BURK|nr:HupE/UreJ family protein [Albitalea terrae]RQP22646.1 urease accessory protein UreJ [Albitalea terrae]
MRLSRNSLQMLATLVVAALPVVAHAHVEEGSLGALDGFLHPIKGADHLLAMLSVGIVSAQIGGRSIWLVPALFVLAMIGGGVVGLNQIMVPHVELGVALSVVALGLAIVFADKRSNVTLVMLFVMLFGALHGHAHGLEAPKTASPIFYSFGFVISTALIHLVGVLVGFLVTEKSRVRNASTYLGCLVSAAGVYFLAGLY